MNIQEAIDENSNLYAAALNHWGEEVMLRWLQEEATELALAASHYHRNKIPKEELLDEAADTLVMILQIARHLGTEEFCEAVHQKTLRLIEKVRDEAPFVKETNQRVSQKGNNHGIRGRNLGFEASSQ